MHSKRIYRLIFALTVVAVFAHADSLELKNGSLINGKFMGGSQTMINFQVGSSVQSYELTDIRSLRFASDGTAASSAATTNPPIPSSREKQSEVGTSSVTIPAGTRISIRTIDAIDSTKHRAGYRFQASLEEPISVDGNTVIPKGADVYGRLDESKETGTFTGRSELKLELTGIVVHGQTLPLVTGEYGVSGKSKAESTAKRSVGGAAIGSIIGALAGGGKGAAIGAGTGAGVGAGSEIIAKGDQVKIPSETLLQFTLQQSLIVPK